jgi:guanylate kinase
MSGRPGQLIVISGPSGAGKSTIVRRLIQQCPLPLRLSVSATTRPPRPGEVEGVHYRFLSPEQFETLRRQGEFLECKEVFGRGHWYGTLRQPVTAGLQQGLWVILEIDVQGALSVLDQGLEPITIFLHPGGMHELERRLRRRGTESEAAIRRRLEVARQEMEALPRYRYEVINQEVAPTVARICEILQTHEEQACSKS